MTLQGCQDLFLLLREERAEIGGAEGCIWRTLRHSRSKKLYCELLRNRYLPDNIVRNILNDD